MHVLRPAVEPQHGVVRHMSDAALPSPGESQAGRTRGEEGLRVRVRDAAAEGRGRQRFDGRTAVNSRRVDTRKGAPASPAHFISTSGPVRSLSGPFDASAGGGLTNLGTEIGR